MQRQKSHDAFCVLVGGGVPPPYRGIRNSVEKRRSQLAAAFVRLWKDQMFSRSE